MYFVFFRVEIRLGDENKNVTQIRLACCLRQEKNGDFIYEDPK